MMKIIIGVGIVLLVIIVLGIIASIKLSGDISKGEERRNDL